MMMINVDMLLGTSEQFSHDVYERKLINSENGKWVHKNFI